MTPTTPGPHSAPDWRFSLAAFVAILLTLAVVQVREAHRWRPARQGTISDYYTPNKELEP
jgi:hypothetical protein